MQTDSAQGAWEYAVQASVNFVAWLASCGIRAHNLPLTERVLCQLSYRGHVVSANKTWYLLFYFPMSAKVHALWQPSLWSKFLKAPRELS